VAQWQHVLWQQCGSSGGSEARGGGGSGSSKMGRILRPGGISKQVEAEVRIELWSAGCSKYVQDSPCSSTNRRGVIARRVVP
jgi:hypothetical protein